MISLELWTALFVMASASILVCMIIDSVLRFWNKCAHYNVEDKCAHYKEGEVAWLKD